MSCDAKSLKRFKKLHKQLHEALKTSAAASENQIGQSTVKGDTGLTVKHESK